MLTHAPGRHDAGQLEVEVDGAVKQNSYFMKVDTM